MHDIKLEMNKPYSRDNEELPSQVSFSAKFKEESLALKFHIALAALVAQHTAAQS